MTKLLLEDKAWRDTLRLAKSPLYTTDCSSATRCNHTCWSFLHSSFRLLLSRDANVTHFKLLQLCLLLCWFQIQLCPVLLLYLVFQPLHHYSCLGRVTSTHSSPAKTPHCPFAKLRMSCTHKDTSNDIYFKIASSCSKQSLSAVHLNSTKTLKPPAVHTVYGYKTLPADQMTMRHQMHWQNIPESSRIQQKPPSVQGLYITVFIIYHYFHQIYQPISSDTHSATWCNMLRSIQLWWQCYMFTSETHLMGRN